MRWHPATFGVGLAACLHVFPGVVAAEPQAPSAASQAASVSSKPIPEYAPVRSVILSEDLFNYSYRAAELVDAIVTAGATVLVATPAPRNAAQFSRLLDKGMVGPLARTATKSIFLPHDNIWLRDYAPLFLVTTTPLGPRLGLADLRYESGSKTNDALPKTLALGLGLPLVDVPVFLDGGNVLVAGDLCITTTLGPEGTTTELQPGPLALQRDHGKALGCRQVLVLADPPHPHLDMWAKVVSDKVILVNEIDAQTMHLATEQGSGYPASQLKAALDQMATALGKHIEVRRLPMPLPFRGTFRTYANALLVNGTAIVPSFERFGWSYGDYPDAELLPALERRVAEVYESAGFRVRRINADGMIYNGGAFHCVTATLPELPFFPSTPLKGL